MKILFSRLFLQLMVFVLLLFGGYSCVNAQSGGNGGTGSGDGCFIAGTQIIMDDDSTKNIESVKIGDMVKTVNTRTMEIENNLVLDLLTRFHSGEGDDFTVKIRFENGNENQNTNTHPYYTVKKGWASYRPDLTLQSYGLKVELLKTGDTVYELINNRLEKIKIVEIEEVHEPLSTYNLSEVANNSNFFAGGILVHNKGSGNGSPGSCGNGPSGSCFLPGTPVQMQDGTIRAIEDVEVGDQVVGYDIEGDEFTKNIVEELESPVRSEWFKVILDNGRTLRTTDDHPIYIREYDDWASIDPVATWKNSGYKMKTEQLKIGQHVMDLEEEYARIIFILNVPEEVQTYNLKKVSNNNSFFAENTLVHNKNNSSGGSGDFSFSINIDPCAFNGCALTDVTGLYMGPGPWNWSAPSACSVTCGGGEITQTRDCSGCPIATVKTTPCNTQPCCVPNCNAAPNFCLGANFADSCGGINACVGTDNCGGDTCASNPGDVEHEYCKDGNIWSKYDGTLQGCAGVTCFNNHRYCDFYEKEICAVGYTCGQIDTNNARCVVKSATWIEE
jgi:hypothetical protein